MKKKVSTKDVKKFESLVAENKKKGLATMADGTTIPLDEVDPIAREVIQNNKGVFVAGFKTKRKEN